MADDQIQVELVARFDQLTSALNEAASAVQSCAQSMAQNFGVAREGGEQLEAGVQNAAEGVKSNLGEAGEAGAQFGSKMETALNLGIFLELKEVATEALDAVREAYEQTVGKAEEFGLNNAKMAAVLGISTTEAAGLSAALHGVGVSTDQYLSVSMMATERFQEEGTELEALGVKIRDANGDYKQGKEAIDALTAAMAEYPDKAQQIANTALGTRRAVALYDIARANNEEVEHSVEIFQKWGVQLGDTSNAAAAEESTLNDLHTEFEAISDAIGQHLMGTLSSLEKWCSGDGAAAFGIIGTTLKYFAEAVGVIAVVAVQVFINICEALLGILELVLTTIGVVAGVIGDVLSGNFTKAAADISNGGQIIEDKFKAINKVVDETNASFEKFYGFSSGKTQPVAAQKSGGYGTTGQKRTGKQQEQFEVSGIDQFLAKEDKLIPLNEQLTQQEKALADARKYGDAVGEAKAEKAIALTQREIAEEKKRQEGSGASNAQKAAEEQIQAKERADLEVVASEEEKDRHLLAMGQMTEDEYASAQIAAEQKSEAIKVAAAQRQADLYKKGTAEYERYASQIPVIEQQTQDRIQAIKDRAAEKAMQDQENETQYANQQAAQRLNDSVQKVEQEYTDGIVSYTDRANLERELTQTTYSECLKRLNVELATLKEGTSAYRQVMKERENLQRSFTKDMEKIDRQYEKDSQKTWSDLGKSMQSSINSSISSMIRSGTSFKSSMSSLFWDLSDDIVMAAMKWVEGWITQQMLALVVGETSTETQHRTMVEAYAGEAYGAAYQSAAAIPYVGWLIAPGAATEAFTSVMAFASAAQGMELDQDQLVFAHKGEQILPAPIAGGLKQIIQNGGSKNAANLTYSPTVNAPASKSLNQLLTNESSTMLKWLNARMRDGSLKTQAA